MTHHFPELLSLIVFCSVLSACVSTTSRGDRSGKDPLSRFLSKHDRKVLTFVGYSSAGYQDEAAMMRTAAEILDSYDPQDVIVNIGVTPQGIGQVYRLAKERGFTTMGIVSSQAKSLPVSDHLDHAFYIEDETWGGRVDVSNRLSPTSSQMVRHSDIMIGIGGGEVARDELLAARKAGKDVRFFPAELDHQTAIKKATGNGQPTPIDFSGAAAKAFSD